MVRKRFITPANVPTAEICRGLVLPNSRDWLGVFSEALSQTIYPYNYEQINDTDLTPEEAAAEAYERYTAWLDAVCASGSCTLPGGQKIYRTRKIDSDTTIYEYYDGEDWVEDEDIPTTSAREEETEDNQLCAAAANAVNALRLTWLEVDSYYEESVAAQDAQVDTAIFISGLIGTFFYPPIAGLFALAQAGWEIVYYAYEIVSAVDWDDYLTDSLVCIFKEHATVTDGVVSFDTEAILKALWANAFTGQAYITIVAQIEYLINQIGKPAIDAAGALTAIEGDCSHCGVWCQTFQFSESTYNWSAIRETGSVLNAPGAWDGSKWIGTVTTDGTTYSLKIMLGIQFDNTTLTEVEVLYSRTNGQLVATINANRVMVDNWDVGVDLGHREVILTSNTPGATGNDITLSTTGEWDDVQSVTISLSASYRYGAQPSPLGSLSISMITLRGIGENPFGQNNCI